jgi:hypothetical protein
LLYHIAPELLQASVFAMKKQAAPEIDGEMWRDYAIEKATVCPLNTIHN